MKNLTGKTLIFYTFQQKKQLQYNVIAYQPQQQPVHQYHKQKILIKDVIEQLPINLSQGRYHFRFKSEFFEGNQKIAGWIDINNLTAKVPLVGGSVCVKILKVKSNAHNKMFNLEKLARVGLGMKKSMEKIAQVKSPHVNNKVVTNARKQDVRPLQPTSSVSRQTEPSSQQKSSPTTSFQCNNSFYLKEINLMQGVVNKNSQPPLQSQPKPQRSSKQEVNPQLNNPPQSSAKKGEDLFQFQQVKLYKNQQTTKEKLQFFKQTMAAEQSDKQNQAIARDQLQQKIKKWGYSGAKTINNLTTLLSTLHQIWPEWPELSLTELLNPQKLAAHTKKALIKTHPDKNRNKQFRDKYLAKRVFELLNQAKKAALASS